MFLYNVIFHVEPEGGYSAIVPSLPGCVSYGKTLADARRMIEDAIGAYVASLKKHRDPVPSDNTSFVTTIQVAMRPSRLSRAYAAKTAVKAA